MGLENVCRDTVSTVNGAPAAVDCPHRFSAAGVEFEVVTGSGRWTRICMDCAAASLRAGLTAAAAGKDKPGAAAYRRVRHAAHYQGAGDRRGHDLDEWDVTAESRPSLDEKMTAGVPAGADFHHGYVDAERRQHWVYTRFAPMGDGVCDRCEVPAVALAGKAGR